VGNVAEEALLLLLLHQILAQVLSRGSMMVTKVIPEFIPIDCTFKLVLSLLRISIHLLLLLVRRS
jgi:hypothetical protein